MTGFRPSTGADGEKGCPGRTDTITHPRVGLFRGRAGYGCSMSQGGRRALVGAELDEAESLVGHTPLVPLRRLQDRTDLRVWAKLEMFNPGGSAKDRTALAMLRRGWAEGSIGPDSIIVESSSGNLGVALARWCSRLELSFHCVVDSKANPATVALIGALGGVVHRVTEPDAATGDLLAARMARVRELVATMRGAVWLNQYANPAALQAHAGTMREIAEALDHRVDALFVAVSTTGTLGGCRRYIQQHGMTTRVVAVDAAGSVLFGGERSERHLTGFGAGTVPTLAQHLQPDGVARIGEVDTVIGCRLLAAREAIVAGASSGAVVQAFLHAAPALPSGAQVVLLLHDGGVPYLDSVYDDGWVERRLGVGADELRRRLSAAVPR